MGEIRYIISDASKQLEVEQHTLRYWEEELELHIPRNEMGHRYYRQEDVDILRAVKVLKEKGYQLRAIKMLLPEIMKLRNMDTNEVEKVQQEWDKKYMDGINESLNLTSLTIQNSDNPGDETMMASSLEKLEQFKVIMSNMITEVLKDNNEALSETVSDAVTNSVIKEMDYLLRIKEEREEERFKQFDRTLREIQFGRAEYAAARDKKRKKKGLFKL
ncbi:helix-turn-helix domain-containing protein [Anaerocolumna sp.]|uniref:helix-turn-helix domain-containing protein n=1 Tax=Anaerocolumna sp. TaxID=2041569 RepID=UPI0028AD28FE|nr:helix-turn-helix domain-containing protein [Anaerocolumna sp.]